MKLFLTELPYKLFSRNFFFFSDGTKVIQIHNLEGFVVVVEAGVEVVVS